MSVRPVLLDLYERHYLAVGQGLVPGLPGMVLGLLPGLEEESEHTERWVWQEVFSHNIPLFLCCKDGCVTVQSAIADSIIIL